jgi:hypothetical protein
MNIVSAFPSPCLWPKIERLQLFFSVPSTMAAAGNFILFHPMAPALQCNVLELCLRASDAQVHCTHWPTGWCGSGQTFLAAPLGKLVRTLIQVGLDWNGSKHSLWKPSIIRKHIAVKLCLSATQYSTVCGASGAVDKPGGHFCAISNVGSRPERIISNFYLSEEGWSDGRVKKTA